MELLTETNTAIVHDDKHNRWFIEGNFIVGEKRTLNNNLSVQGFIGIRRCCSRENSRKISTRLLMHICQQSKKIFETTQHLQTPMPRYR